MRAALTISRSAPLPPRVLEPRIDLAMWKQATPPDEPTRYTVTGPRGRLEFWREGECEILFEEEALRAQEAALLGPDPTSAETMALWMRQVCDGARPLPLILHSQFAACLYATGYCEDINQAKALAAISASQQRVA